MVDPPKEPDSVAFATRVTILRNDGRRQVYAIVGEDESDPTKGYLAYTSPLARALMGKAEADVVDIPGGEAEINPRLATVTAKAVLFFIRSPPAMHDPAPKARDRASAALQAGIVSSIPSGELLYSASSSCRSS